LKLTEQVEELMVLTGGDGAASSGSSGGLSAAMTAEDTSVDILKTIEEILEHFEDDPSVAEDNPDDASYFFCDWNISTAWFKIKLESIVDIVEEILNFLESETGVGDAESKKPKKKTTTEEPEEETKKRNNYQILNY
jgi:hypothetical protein